MWLTILSLDYMYFIHVYIDIYLYIYIYILNYHLSIQLSSYHRNYLPAFAGDTGHGGGTDPGSAQVTVASRLQRN